jgi:hypothetical protein
MQTKILVSAISALLLCQCLSAQIVNTEKLRFFQKENGWVGDADFRFGLARNKAGQTLSLGSSGRLEYLLDQNRWMVLGGYYLTQFRNVNDPGTVPRNFNNWGFSHFRYNRTLGKRLTVEAFLQGQFDEVQEIDFRFLSGTGLRLHLHETDSSTLYWGTLLMFEYEESSDDPNNEANITYHRDLRLSTYLSAAFKVKNYLTCNQVTYFQPNVMAWGDFRISSETRLSIKIRKNLSLDTYFLLIYDTQPARTVPRTMYSLTNGLSLSIG